MKSPVSTSASYAKPVFQTVIETAQGGFTLSDSVIAAGTEIPAGVAVGYDESTRLAKLAKVGVMQASATNVATTYQILKGSILQVGMSVNLTGGTARAITAIDTSNANFDTITVGTTIGVAAVAGDALFVNDIGYSAPNGLLYAPVTVEQNTELAVVIRGTVYHRRVAPVPAVMKTILRNIIFSESF